MIIFLLIQIPLNSFTTTFVPFVTFHAPRNLDLNIMVDSLGMMVVFEHCLCAMFSFQPSSLHISKDVSYDFNNFVSSFLYQIPMTSLQGRQWVVDYGYYRIVGDNLVHDSQEIILTIGIAGFVVEIMKQELEVDLMFLHFLFSLNCLILLRVRT